MQRIIQRKKNDCLRCCVAMVLGLPYEDVPNFVEVQPKAWTAAVREWLAPRGLSLVQIGVDVGELPGSPVIAVGRAITMGFHAVVMDGKMIDPDPLALGLIEAPKYRFAIVPARTLPAAA